MKSGSLYKMNIKFFLSLIFFLGMLSSSSSSEAPLDGFPDVLYDHCELQPFPYYYFTSRSSPFHALARVNSTGKVLPQSNENDGLIFCKMVNKDKSLNGIVALELILHADPPSIISFQTAYMFRSDLESSTIICSYSDIGPDSRVNGSTFVNPPAVSEVGSFICCGISGLKINFTSFPRHMFLQPGYRKHSKRSTGELNTPASPTKCSTGSLKPDGYQNLKFIGKVCSIKDDDFKIGRRWMFNIGGSPDCLPCCIDHHWDEYTKQCEKCPPGTTQPQLNVWRHCEFAHVRPSSAPTTTAIPRISTYPPFDFTEQTPSTFSSRSFPTTQTTNLEPSIKPPTVPLVAYVGLVGANHAIIWWKAALEKSEPVFKYKVNLRSLESRETRDFETGETWIELEGLNSGFNYIVKVQAGNSAGYGPWSDDLKIATSHELSNSRTNTEADRIEVRTEQKPEEEKLPVAYIVIGCLVVAVLIYFIVMELKSRKGCR